MTPQAPWDANVVNAADAFSHNRKVHFCSVLFAKDYLVKTRGAQVLRWSLESWEWNVDNIRRMMTEDNVRDACAKYGYHDFPPKKYR